MSYEYGETYVSACHRLEKERDRLRAINAELLQVLSIITLNAQIQPDASMSGTTDCYAVPLDDIEAARAALAKATSI